MISPNPSAPHIFSPKHLGLNLQPLIIIPEPSALSNSPESSAPNQNRTIGPGPPALNHQPITSGPIRHPWNIWPWTFIREPSATCLQPWAYCSLKPSALHHLLIHHRPVWPLTTNLVPLSGPSLLATPLDSSPSLVPPPCPSWPLVGRLGSLSPLLIPRRPLLALPPILAPGPEPSEVKLPGPSPARTHAAFAATYGTT